MKLRLKSLAEYLTKPVYRSKNVTRKDGTKLIIAKMNDGIFIIDTECNYNYTKYIKRG